VRRSSIALGLAYAATRPTTRSTGRFIDVLERRLGELAVRGEHDLAMAAQLEVLPDQLDVILNKLATTQADVSEVSADVKLLLEQTDDAVRFAEDTRIAERHTLVSS
jgi:hypothetical protein